jgi:hypothetical protein
MPAGDGLDIRSITCFRYQLIGVPGRFLIHNMWPAKAGVALADADALARRAVPFMADEFADGVRRWNASV